MNLTLKINYNTVVLNGKTVKFVENYEKDNMVYRFVDTLANCSDEAAVSYILNKDYENTRSYIISEYNELSAELKKKARIFDTFGIETGMFSRNVGAGFSALVKEEDYDRTVALIKELMHVTGLDKEYELLSRYENLAVYAIVRK